METSYFEINNKSPRIYGEVQIFSSLDKEI